MNFTRGILSPWFPPKGYSTTHIDPPAWTDVAPNHFPFNFFCLDTFLVWNQLWHLALPIPSTSLGSEEREAHVNQQLCLHVAYSIALSQSKELCAERSKQNSWGSKCHHISQNQASTHTYIEYGVHILYQPIRCLPAPSLVACGLGDPAVSLAGASFNRFVVVVYTLWLFNIAMV
jgi:hypothetical protein